MEIMKAFADFLKLPFWLQCGAGLLLLLVLAWMLMAANHLYLLRPAVVERVTVPGETQVEYKDRIVVHEKIVYRDAPISIDESIHISIKRHLKIVMDETMSEREPYPADVVAETHGDQMQQTVKFTLILRDKLEFEKGAYTLDRALSKSGFLNALSGMLFRVREFAKQEVNCEAEIVGSADGQGFDKRIGAYGGEIDFSLAEDAIIDGVTVQFRPLKGQPITNSQLGYLRAYFTRKAIADRLAAEKATTNFHFDGCRISGGQTSRVGAEFRSVSITLVFRNSDLGAFAQLPRQ